MQPGHNDSVLPAPRPAGSVELRNRIFAEFLATLDRHRIAFALLGRVEGYPETIGSDVDFLVNDADLARMPELMQEVAERSGGWLVQCLQHEIGAACHVIAVAVGSTIAYLPLDVTGSFRYRGQLWLNARSLLSRRRDNVAGHPVPAPADAFAYYLIKCIGKRSLDEYKLAHLRETFAQDPVGSIQLLERRAGSIFAARISALLAGESPVNRDELDSLALLLDGSSVNESLHSRIRGGIGEYCWRWRRLQEPTGLVLAFLGPDGAGKSTVISAAEQVLMPAFRNYSYFHLRPGLLIRGRASAAAAATQPHARAPRSVLASIAKLALLLIEYNVGWWLRVWPRKVRSSLVVFDRYFHDMICDPRRYRWNGPMRLLHAAAMHVPQPDLWFVLDAPAEVLQERKQEVSLEATRAQRLEYRRLAGSLDNAWLIDTSGNVEQCVSEIRDIVLAHMTSRLEARLRLRPAKDHA